MREAQIWLLACSGGLLGHALLLITACAGISQLYSQQCCDSIHAYRQVQAHWGC